MQHRALRALTLLPQGVPGLLAPGPPMGGTSCPAWQAAEQSIGAAPGIAGLLPGSVSGTAPTEPTASFRPGAVAAKSAHTRTLSWPVGVSAWRH